MKFGISFTATFFNQAGALVLIYRDGSVQVNHGGTEMGQGLHTKIAQIAAESLGVTLEAIRVMPTRTDKVPNTSATAASAGADLNGAAVLHDRVPAAAAERLDAQLSRTARLMATALTHSPEVCEAAYRQRFRCSRKASTARPKFITIATTGHGKPFHYFAYGAAVSEVEVDGFTGDYRLLARRYSGRRGRFAFAHRSIAARSKAALFKASAG